MTGSDRIVALLPMKANSQRVKGKNFRLLHGRPLFRWILDSLREVEAIDQVVINTDARSILAENGLTDGPRVLIRDRKPDLCGDHVSMNLILADDVAAIAASAYVMTHTTNPMLSGRTIRSALTAPFLGLLLESIQVTVLPYGLAVRGSFPLQHGRAQHEQADQVSRSPEQTTSDALIRQRIAPGQAQRSCTPNSF